MIDRYIYRWPDLAFGADGRWKESAVKDFFSRKMPESPEELAADSRWPCFFPSPICLVTAGDGHSAAFERVAGPVIVNRFPYVMAISVCRERLSERHYERRSFMKALESSREAAVQFCAPGPALDRALGVIGSTDDARSFDRIKSAGLASRRGVSVSAAVLSDAYMVYEGKLARPSTDLDGEKIYGNPWIDIGSHRVYFLEVSAIQLRHDIAEGASRISWRSLPSWHSPDAVTPHTGSGGKSVYTKNFTPQYRFPSAGTTAFESDGIAEGMSVKKLPLMMKDQIKIDNDAARWPCFFPSPVTMVTSYAADGRPNAMPCGSTAVLARNPMTIAVSICYAKINERYSPRATLEDIRRSGAFGCGVPFIDKGITEAITYSGNVSIADDPDKIVNSGLSAGKAGASPVLRELPVHFDCRVTREIRLGTHIMFLGEVAGIMARGDLSPRNPLEWYPWADVEPAGRETTL
ncbi:MAG: flavin reductase [Candidatus Omnitrophota bacterium]